MTYKGVYRDGIVILQGEVDLENGARVDVNPARGGARKTKKASAKEGKGVKSSRVASTPDRLPAFGIWKDRWPKSMSSAQIACRLRAEVSRRTR